VVFSPSWGVPEKIATKDLFPKIQKDPAFLQRNGFSLIKKEEGAATTIVNPQDVNWEEIDSEEFAYNYLLSQRPGDNNALGKVKFLIPDSSSIYLHDTSQPELFQEDMRSLSSGCIRVEEPKLLTHFILDGQGKWNYEKIETVYDT